MTDGELKEALAAYDGVVTYVGGCSDGNCVVKRPTGMHTNGGCHCYMNKLKMQHVARAGQELSNAVRKYTSEKQS